MSSDPTWKRDANGVEHPGREVLLACIRKQCSEPEKRRVSEHLLAECASCKQLCIRLAEDSAALNHLHYISHHLYYPELQSNQVLLHAQRGEPLTSMWTGKRKRKFQAQNRAQRTSRYTYKRSMRIASLPAALALLLLFMLVAIVLTYALVTISNGASHGQPSSKFYVGQGLNTPGVASHQPTPPIPVTNTPTGSATGPTTIIDGARLKVCSPNHYFGSAIYICGEGFKAGAKVWLEVDYYGSNSLKTLGPYTINKDGKFKAYWSIACKNSPVTVYAANKMQQPLTNPLTNIARDGCYLPTWPGGRQQVTR